MHPHQNPAPRSIGGLLDIVQLRYFLKVAELGSFTRASEDLGVSQPALSRSIAKIEELLGQPVFERQTRCVVLTDAGRVLQQRAIQIVQLLDEIPREICDDGKTGNIRIGAIPTIAPYCLPSILQQAREAYPDATWNIREDVTDRLLQACNIGELDLVIAALPVELGYLDSKTVHEEELLVALPADHLLAAKPVLRPQDLSGEPLVMLGEGHCLSDQIDAYCRRRSIQPVHLDRTAQMATVLELVAAGQGLSFVPQMACRTNTKILYRSLQSPVPKRKIAVVWNAYRFESKLQRGVRNLLERFSWSSV
ncbi:LysR family transcriptional regulator [Pirellulaceae bacterium SH501]